VVARFQPFDLEHWQSQYEQTVAHNLADSSITGVSLGDLVGDDTERLLAIDLHYPEVNGERALRELIATRYPGIVADDVLVTVGASEANALIVDAFCPPGARVVVPSNPHVPSGSSSATGRPCAQAGSCSRTGPARSTSAALDAMTPVVRALAG
jgi:histidinol-phosphate/aromatic aminotransferase/cobyric acid decarboxylase-like protein